MAGWFGQMLAKVADDVVADPATMFRLELVADRVTLDQLKDEAVKSENELSRQFADRVRAIENLRVEIEQADDPLKVSERPVDTDAYREIEYLINKVGSGTIGVAGPRGSGKSTLLKRFASTMIDDKRQQWGVYVPAPAKYDPRDFLLYLFAELCRAVLGEDQAGQVESRLTSTRPPMKRLLPAARVLVFLGAVVLACFAVVIALRTARLGESPHRMTDLEIASCAAIVWLITLAAAYPAYRYGPAGSPGPYRYRSPGSPGPNRYRSPGPRGPYRYIPRERSFRRAAVFSLELISSSLLLILVLSGLTATALFGLFLAGDAPDPGYLAAGGLGAASVIGLFALTRGPLRPRTTSDSASAPPGSREAYLHDYDSSRELEYLDALTAARDYYAKVKFQQSFTTGWSGTITVGTASLPAQAQGGRSGSTAVTPLAMSTPEIVGAINKFTETLARARPSREDPEDTPSEAPTPVVIGIDEIDKIEDPREAQAFLNQIKGLFADDSCLFLVSISDDAMAAFERRGTPFRDAFDSSLSSVVTLSYLSRKEARKLTGSRLVGIQEPAADLLFVLAGGLARDLVRNIRRAVEVREQEQSKTDFALGDLALALIVSEVDAKQKAVLARAGTLEPCSAKDKLLAWAGRRQSEHASAEKYFAAVLTQAESLIASACDDAAHQTSHRKRKATDTGNCLSREIGVFCFWLVTVGQVFSKCSSPDDFIEGESAGSDKSFERLTEARQNFSLGPGYVLARTRAVRTAWDLPAPQALPDEPPAMWEGSPAGTRRAEHGGLRPGVGRPAEERPDDRLADSSAAGSRQAARG